MTAEGALTELLARVGAQSGGPVLITDEELSQWPAAAVAAMKAQKLLAKARPATSVVCPGCERECVMPVHTEPINKHGPASFVVCDKRSDINRVPVSPERLTQWRCDTEAVCGFVATHLGLHRSDRSAVDTSLHHIGIASGEKRTQMLCLRTNGELALVAGNNAVPLSELIGYRKGKYSLGASAIRRLVDSACAADPRYTPTNARREARKLETRQMYRNWQRAYRDLKKRRRHMSGVWYSQQISKLDVAQGRSADTIRKHMSG